MEAEEAACSVHENLDVFGAGMLAQLYYSLDRVGVGDVRKYQPHGLLLPLQQLERTLDDLDAVVFPLGRPERNKALLVLVEEFGSVRFIVLLLAQTLAVVRILPAERREALLSGFAGSQLSRIPAHSGLGLFLNLLEIDHRVLLIAILVGRLRLGQLHPQPNSPSPQFAPLAQPHRRAI